MTHIDLTGAAVGFVIGEAGHRQVVREIIDVHDLDATVVDGHGAFLDAFDDTVPALSYLVLETGPETDRILSRLSAADVDVPTLYVASGAADAAAAMTSGADVCLTEANVSRLGVRLESLHIGAETDGFEAPSSHGLGDVNALAYGTLMEQFDDHIYVFDRHGSFVRVNRAKADFHRRDPADLAGTTDFHYFDPETALEIYRDNLDVMEGERTVENKAEWVESADGELRHVTASKHPIPNDDGVVVGYIGISREITQRTRRKMMIREMKEIIEHLYGAYDHNFRNLSQSQISVQLSLDGGIEHVEDARSHLADVERSLDALEEAVPPAEPGEASTADDAQNAATGTRDSRTAPLAPEESHRYIADLQAAHDSVEASCAASLEQFRQVKREREALTEGLNALIEAFSELISLVKTTGEITSLDVADVARGVFDGTVEAESVVIEADSYKTEICFELLDTEANALSTLRLDDVDGGFRVHLPQRVEVPELTDRFRNQDLRHGPRPMLKLLLVTRAQGWGVETVYPDDGGTELTFDVDRWKREAAESNL